MKIFEGWDFMEGYGLGKEGWDGFVLLEGCDL